MLLVRHGGLPCSQVAKLHSLSGIKTRGSCSRARTVNVGQKTVGVSLRLSRLAVG